MYLGRNCQERLTLGSVYFPNINPVQFRRQNKDTKGHPFCLSWRQQSIILYSEHKTVKNTHRKKLVKGLSKRERLLKVVCWWLNALSLTLILIMGMTKRPLANIFRVLSQWPRVKYIIWEQHCKDLVQTRFWSQLNDLRAEDLWSFFGHVEWFSLNFEEEFSNML